MSVAFNKMANSKKLKKLTILLLLLLIEKPTRQRKRFWVKNWLLEGEKFSHISLIKKLRKSSSDDLKNYLRMDDKTFKTLLRLVKSDIIKKNTKMRRAISAEERLIATLRFLATGRSFEDLKFSTLISPQALGIIIPETCKCIYKVLKKEYLKFPKTREEWQDIARNFESRWNFPNCGGAIHGKHIRIVKPYNSGSYFYNYKGYDSVFLMAMVNADYEFIYVSVGCNGRVSDGGVFETTTFHDRLINGKLNTLSNKTMKENMKFVFVADDAFPLHEHILKPFSHKTLTADKRIFNYRCSRARRTVKNAFGILVNRFRVFRTAINIKPEKINYIVLASCVLHNFLRRHATNAYLPKNIVDTELLDTGDIIPGDWRSENTLNKSQLGYGRNPSHMAKENRDAYKQYFIRRGKVSWQDNFL